MDVFEIVPTGTTAADAATYTRASDDTVLMVDVSGDPVVWSGIIFPANSVVGDKVIVRNKSTDNSWMRVYPHNGTAIDNSFNSQPVGPNTATLFRLVKTNKWIRVQ